MSPNPNPSSPPIKSANFRFSPLPDKVGRDDEEDEDEEEELEDEAGAPLAEEDEVEVEVEEDSEVVGARLADLPTTE